ncbi:MAG: alpha/beta fold hydrolase [Acidimicrobiales bacterium]|nr:alpha/beta fold hydrolase [Acidimicrobiales bacterium]
MVNPEPQASRPLPAADLDGWDASWSLFVDAPDHRGVTRRWYLLDTGATADTRLTVLAVHGNPTWSYTWRHLAAAVPDDVRVIAPDQLEMGFSERSGELRRLGDRIADLLALTDELELSGDVVVVAHDWGGPVSLGWLQHVQADHDGLDIVGLVLTNTAVHQPAESSAPTLIRNARRPLWLGQVTVETSAFLRGMFELSNPRTPAEIRRGYLAPYDTPDRRKAIGEFVADIPLEADHPSAAALDAVAAGLARLGDVPTLLVWGAGDRVFSDIYLHDLEARLPHADVHRHPKAGHLVSEDTDVASIVVDWLQTLGADETPPPLSAPVDLTAALRDPAIADRIAIHEMGADGRSVTFGELDELVQRTAEGLFGTGGVQVGDRVAVMIPPGVDLAIALYACWRMGAVPVLIDGGLGPAQMGAAMKVAHPNHLIGIRRALAAARTLRWPGRRIAVEPTHRVARRLLGVEYDLASLQDAPSVPLPAVDPDAEAAVVFTSGATGPSKGVRYSAARIDTQIRTLVEQYNISADDSLVAAFAPFALYGPAMGIPSTVPDMDVSSPGTLTAATLLDAVETVDASLVFASPAAILSVLETLDELGARDRTALDHVRLLLSAGAPVPGHVLRAAVDRLVPNAAAHTPYGMTECLPVADIDLVSLESLGPDALHHLGVCVGMPVDSVELLIDPLDELGVPTGLPTSEPGLLGEVRVRAAHQQLGYDRLWHTTHLASPADGTHVTGDIGTIDADGRLWIGGRTGHVIRTATGPVAPTPIERAVDMLDGIRRSAAVGVGPAGAQVVVVIAETSDAGRRPRQSSLDRIDRIRAAVAEATGLDVAACLEVPSLPVDHRHNSKIDRTHLADWATGVLEGGSVRNP